MQRRSFAIGRSRLANKSGASRCGPRVREAFEKGRAKSRESGSIVANARNNVTPNVKALREFTPSVKGNANDPFKIEKTNCLLYMAGRKFVQATRGRQASITAKAIVGMDVSVKDGI